MNILFCPLGISLISAVELLLCAYVSRTIGLCMSCEVGLDSGLDDEMNMPTIIWWTPRLFPHVSDEHTEESHVRPANASKGTCYTTTIRNKTYQIGNSIPIAFIFYGSDMEVEDLPLPRLENHRWVLLHEESPMNNYVLSHVSMMELFNYTSTFQRHSDYPLTTLFVPNLAYLTDRRPVALATKNDWRRKGLAPVLYVQSHCDVASDRDRYVLEMSKYIEIDSYGQCLNNKTLPIDLISTETFESSDFLDFVARYKFHLAFENALCDDYVTEKLFRALHVGSVPVYRGSPSVGDWDPNFESVIQVNMFPTPKHLAHFISHLDSSDDDYEKYLTFKKPNGITNELLLSTLKKRDWSNIDYDKDNFVQGFERYICEKLLENEIDLSQDNDLSYAKANMHYLGCPEPSISIGDLEDFSANEKNNLMEWIDNYKYSESLAKAVNKMIRMNKSDSSDIHNFAYTNYRDEL